MTKKLNDHELLNAIHNNASDGYKNTIPVSDGTLDSKMNIHKALGDYSIYLNEFNGLLGKVILQLYANTERLFENKLDFLIKGEEPFGSTIEEIYMNLIQGIDFNPDGILTGDTTTSESNLKRVKPTIQTMYHDTRVQTVYKITISREQSRTAFYSENGLSKFVNSQIQNLHNSINYEMYTKFKTLIGTGVTGGAVKTLDITEPLTEADTKAFIKQVRKIASQFTYMSSTYNPSDLMNFSNTSDIILLLNNKYTAEIDVDVLSTSFNSQYANVGNTGVSSVANKPLISQVVEIDDIPGVTNFIGLLIDKRAFVIYNELYEQRTVQNGAGLFDNIFTHVWKKIGMSKFHNAVMLQVKAPV